MMKAMFFMWVLFLCCIAAKGQDLSKCKKVAETKQVGKNKVVVCDRSLLKDTLTLPLSYFTEELQMVKLESKNEALVSESHTIVGEKYILVKGRRQNPYKLFEKSGKYIADVGSYGKGPNEYLNVYDQQLDEKNNRIYILPWQSDKILVYDLKGAALEPIRLPLRVPKGKFWVDPSGTTVSVTTLPFNGLKYVAWTQKLSGEVISGIEPGFLALKPDFSNEMNSSKNTDTRDILIFTFAPRIDTLYHYDAGAGKLVPQFTVDFKNQKLPIHNYSELPRHYMGEFSEPKQISERNWTNTNFAHYIIEKSTLKGSYFKLTNDFLGNISVWPNFAFADGFYVRNLEPAHLLEILEKALSEKKMSTDMRAKLTKLKNSIKETDNNYVFYAKLK